MPLVKYTDDCGDLFTVEEFIEASKLRFITDFDGFGHPTNGEGMMDTDVYIYPSKLSEIHADTKHIMWFNK